MTKELKLIAIIKKMGYIIKKIGNAISIKEPFISEVNGRKYNLYICSIYSKDTKQRIKHLEDFINELTTNQ